MSTPSHKITANMTPDELAQHAKDRGTIIAGVNGGRVEFPITGASEQAVWTDLCRQLGLDWSEQRAANACMSAALENCLRQVCDHEEIGENGLIYELSDPLDRTGRRRHVSS